MDDISIQIAALKTMQSRLENRKRLFDAFLNSKDLITDYLVNINGIGIIFESKTISPFRFLDRTYRLDMCPDLHDNKHWRIILYHVTHQANDNSKSFETVTDVFVDDLGNVYDNKESSHAIAALSSTQDILSMFSTFLFTAVNFRI